MCLIYSERSQGKWGSCRTDEQRRGRLYVMYHDVHRGDVYIHCCQLILDCLKVPEVYWDAITLLDSNWVSSLYYSNPFFKR